MLLSFKLICILLLTFVNCVICKNVNFNEFDPVPKNNEDELIFAHSLCRHGDRNIYFSYPNDPYQDERLWPDGFMELTNIGKQQMYLLGKYLRDRYSKLFDNGAYSPNVVYVQSTDIDRVLMSAQASMAGMFPPASDKKWIDKLNWQPIPVHTLPFTEDYTLATYKRCDRFDYLMIDYLKTEEYQELIKKYQLLIEYLELSSGKKLPTLVDINDLYDTLSIERLKGMRLPEWTEEIMHPNYDFEHLAMFYFRIFTSTVEMKRLKSGFLLKEILNRFTNKTQQTLSPDRFLWMYFAHDNTIANMLNSLGLYKLHQPPYASCLFFELYNGNGKPYVQIFYRNSTEIPNPSALNIPGCGSKCELTKMYDLYHDILPTHDFEHECRLRDGEQLPFGGNPENGPL